MSMLFGVGFPSSEGLGDNVVLLVTCAVWFAVVDESLACFVTHRVRLHLVC